MQTWDRMCHDCLLRCTGLPRTDRPLTTGLPHSLQMPCRLQNHLPATRLTAMALEAFLKASGFQMNRIYGRQFKKLLGHIDAAFLPELERQGDPEARPVYSRLRTYMHSCQFQKEPELRRMPVSDESTADLAYNENERW